MSYGTSMRHVPHNRVASNLAAELSSPLPIRQGVWIKVKNPKAPAMLRIVEGGW